MITSKQRSLIGLAALFAIASTQACGSSDEPTTPAGGAPGVAGMPAVAGMGTSGGGAAAAGMPGVAGAPAGGGGAFGTGGAAAGSPAVGGGGASGGTGGASAGSGGSSAGSGGKGGSGGKSGSGGSGGGSAGGGNTPTYAMVQAIFNASCGNACHNGNPHTNFTTGDLYTTLSTPIPATPAMRECKGSTMITPNDGPNSLIVKILNGSTMCQNSGANQTIVRMPYMCNGNTCLTAAQIKTISDWITGGAPH